MTWIKTIKYLLSYKLKVTTHTKRIITVKKLMQYEDYLLKKYPNNNNIEVSIINTLKRLVKRGYLLEVKRGFKLNPNNDKVKQYLPTKNGTAWLGDCVIERVNNCLYANYYGHRFKIGTEV